MIFVPLPRFVFPTLSPLLWRARSSRRGIDVQEAFIVAHACVDNLQCCGRSSVVRITYRAGLPTTRDLIGQHYRATDVRTSGGMANVLFATVTWQFGSEQASRWKGWWALRFSGNLKLAYVTAENA
jgi:hypothetical protein